MIVVGNFDLLLVVLSVVIATAASFTALDLAGRIRASSGRPRQAWLAAPAIAIGRGIWSMHFVALLAFVLPMPATYDFGLTILSLLVPVLLARIQHDEPRAARRQRCDHGPGDFRNALHGHGGGALHPEPACPRDRGAFIAGSSEPCPCRLGDDLRHPVPGGGELGCRSAPRRE